MPRRPDPETGLIARDNLVAAQLQEWASEGLPVMSATHPYPQLRTPPSRAPHSIPTSQQPRILVIAEQDMARQRVRLHVSQLDENGNMTYLAPQWVPVAPGESVSHLQPLLLSERDARSLAESIDSLTGRRERLLELERSREEMRLETHSIANRLEEVRNHRDTLSETNAFLRRQVTWLERELRDSNRERRGIVTPEPAPSQFDG